MFPTGSRRSTGRSSRTAKCLVAVDMRPLLPRLAALMVLGLAATLHRGAVGRYGGPYASVYGAQQVGGLAGKGPGSSGIPRLQSRQTTLSESSKFSSGAVGSSLGRSNDDYLAPCGYAQKQDQYSANYALERSMYGEQQLILAEEMASLIWIEDILIIFLEAIRQADYFAGRTGPIHQGSKEVGAYGRVKADYHNLSILGSAPYGGQQPASLLGGAHRTNIDSLVYGQGSSSNGYGVGLPPGHDYASGKGLLHASSESDYRDSILPGVHPGISMVDERTRDQICYRRELDLRDDEHRRDLLWEREKEREWEREQEQELRDCERERERDRERVHDRQREHERERERERKREHIRERREKERERDRKHGSDPRRERTPPRTPGERRCSCSVRSEKPLWQLSHQCNVVHRWTSIFSL